MNRLLHSAKFWTMIVDAAVSVATFFIGRFAGASAEDMLYLVGIFQPIVLTVVIGIFVEDAAAKKANTFTH